MVEATNICSPRRCRKLVNVRSGHKPRHANTLRAFLDIFREDLSAIFSCTPEEFKTCQTLRSERGDSEEDTRVTTGTGKCVLWSVIFTATSISEPHLWGMDLDRVNQLHPTRRVSQGFGAGRPQTWPERGFCQLGSWPAMTKRSRRGRSACCSETGCQM